MLNSYKKKDAEKELSHQLALNNITFKNNYRFHSERRWRFDFAIIDQKVAIEVEGITYYGKNKNGTMRLGRHQTAKGYQGDLEKYLAARLLGWDVVRVSQFMVRDGTAINAILSILDVQ